MSSSTQKSRGKLSRTTHCGMAREGEEIGYMRLAENERLHS